MLVRTEWQSAGLINGHLDIVHVSYPPDEATESAMLHEWMKATPEYFPCRFNSDSLLNAVHELYEKTGCRKDAAAYTACFNVLVANGYLLKRGEDESAAKMYRRECKIWLG